MRKNIARLARFADTASKVGGSQHLARDEFVRTCSRELPSATACFEDDFEACIAHLRLPVGHRRVIRTTNLLERMFGEERRRTKAIPEVCEPGLGPSQGDDRSCSTSPGHPCHSGPTLHVFAIRTTKPSARLRPL